MARQRSDSPPLFVIEERPDFAIEARLIARGAMLVAGVDEAGRGPLAGPVVAAAVVLDPDRIPDGLDDSKRLTAVQREALFALILASARGVGVASLSAPSIDAADILRASLEAMRRAIAALPLRPDHVLADGRDVPPGLRCGCDALIKGDRRSQSVAAASIVAKVLRDRMMSACGAVHVGFGFERHMGYGTAAHLAAISAHGGIARLHRMTFSPLKAESA